jgi:flagellar hook-associated protein 2
MATTTSSTSSSLSSATASALASTPAATAAASKANAQKLKTSLGAGSGVDVNALAENLVNAERVPRENAINAKITKNESRISGYSALSYVLSNVKTAMTALKDQNNFNAVTATNSNTNAFGVTTSAAATTGTHEIEVLRLAKAQRTVSAGFASGSASLNGGSAMTLSLTVGDASKVTPTVSTTQGVAAVTESSVVTFQALLAGKSVTVGGLTYTATQDSTADEVAAAFAGLQASASTPTDPAKGTFTGALAGFNAGVNNNGQLTFTSSTAGSNVSDLAVTTTANAAPTVTTTQGVSAVTEYSAVTFKDMAAGQSVTVAGLTYTTTAAATAAQVASVFASLSASATTPTNPSTGTFSGALTGFNAGGNLGTGTLYFSSTTAGANVSDIAVSGASARVSLAAGKDTPQDLVNAINATTAGVTAQLVNTGDGSASPYQIVLTGPMGAAGSFAVSTNYGSGTGTPGLIFPANQSGNQSAVDALVKVDGVSYTRANNTISDVVTGLTLNLKSTTSSAAVVDLTRDTTTIKDNIKAIVTAYNDATTIFKEVSDPKSTFDTYGATLVGDSTVRTVKQQLRDMVMGNSSTPGQSVGALWQMGLSIDQTGVMSVDDTKLADALDNHYSDVVKTFTGNQNGLTVYSPAPAGIAGDAVKKLTNMLGKTGILVTQTQSATTQNDKYKEDLTKLQTRMDALLVRYQKQFASMDSLVGNVNSQKTSLKSTFDGMMASLTGKSG